MKKLVSLMITFVMILSISIPSFAVDYGNKINFEPGTSQTSVVLYESVNYPWKAMPGSYYNGAVTLYSPEPVKSIDEASHFVVTPVTYLESWSPIYDGSKPNPNSKGNNDAYVTEFQIRACFLDSNGWYTRPPANVSAGDVFEEEIRVVLENNQSMTIPCVLELTNDATIYWDIRIDQNVEVKLGQESSIDAYIGAKNNSSGPYTIKWNIESDSVELRNVTGPDGSMSAATSGTTSNITKSGDLFLGSSITFKPTELNNFWLESELYDSNGQFLTNWRVYIRVVR